MHLPVCIGVTSTPCHSTQKLVLLRSHPLLLLLLHAAVIVYLLKL